VHMTGPWLAVNAKSETQCTKGQETFIASVRGYSMVQYDERLSLRKSQLAVVMRGFILILKSLWTSPF
jgi:hypothetical protein